MIGPPSRICRRNNGTTDPDEPNTLPKRTIQKVVLLEIWLKPCNTSSHKRLLAPITLGGLTALSVEISTNRSTPVFKAACAV